MSRDGQYFVITDRWQRFSNVVVNEETFVSSSASADEFSVHGVDVEGKRLGTDVELVSLLGKCSPMPVRYAGDARSLDDHEMGILDVDNPDAVLIGRNDHALNFITIALDSGSTGSKRRPYWLDVMKDGELVDFGQEAPHIWSSTSHVRLGFGPSVRLSTTRSCCSPQNLAQQDAKIPNSLTIKSQKAETSFMA
ncbi:unnamed protein product [Calypogeia fissa]